ncbi:DUF488 family protein [Sphingoaurantiacus capsulatus]|uniref:DUF488 family protein n=1 Tax=Sphingoaurantiacus capsulatus TaxID=1771310 RepID=A0ABV7XAY5_9SPHN
MTRLFTIGYEGATIDAFIDTLEKAGVKTLVDVRAVPLSRKPGFSKRGLAAALAERGIGYRHLQRLGTPTEGRNAARAGNIAKMRDIYLTHLEAPDAQAEMAMLADQARESPSALLCFERDPGQCHRSILFEQLDTADLTAEHLFVPPAGRE